MDKFDVEDLIALIRNYNPRTDEKLIRLAYDYGQRMHEGQTRHSGEPYFTHPVAVAAILTEMRLDDATLVTALLHDTIEDTRASWSEVSDKFGREIADLVDGVTKLTNLELSGAHSKQAENFRKLFMAMTRDLRVILVKLADRLHNMRTIRAMRPDKQAKKARETMDIYAPLAGRMGMQWMREELEDLAFKVINPEARNSIIRRFLTLQKESGDVIAQITRDIRTELDREGIEANVYGRAKRPFSVWRKMQEKQLTFSRLSDIYGFRVIVDTESECYRALGLIHRRWRAVPGRFKDYISQPKSNGYRSIHTTVTGRDGKRVEVQIRTRQMHEVAEAGVAAHWAYRDGQRSTNPFAVDPAEWIAQLNDRLGGEDHDEFLEHVKLEMYSDQVFIFTPKGDVIQLPKGATPIDFAYAIHTRIGNSTVGAKVDGIRVPLWTRLKNGQLVEIITAAGQRPQAAWLEIVQTGRAKAAIRRSLREEDRARLIRLGAELVRISFEHHGRRVTDKALRTAATKLALPDSDELLARIGCAEMSAQDVLTTLYPELSDHKETVDPKRPVAGLEADQTLGRAQCCQPLPGERIVGITYRGRGVIIHSIDCPALAELDNEEDMKRWVDLQWREGRHPPAYPVTLSVTIRHDAGVLGRICTLIGSQGANISNLTFADRKPDFYRLEIEVELHGLDQLHALLTALEAESDVAQVTRLLRPDLAP
ncbi:MAG TPA: bifunctional (p)ppGpp synthetase/guanosine-3',5'-bis(diphosphate) 3'-pyrophosphohydrolase [Paracoccus sp. (in: a-proteobacteria)]|uniref:RelA/SpoT family protein n=1 Tax=uncultured Paracoccus sp. TaxID=189685 RepID=UPI002632B04C|nr:bifunctional (p)ppGpp synthetase/guanosine-3',5'-bis(diphosphate) 3'-pyrophosphohydrolase [uncultured Paracoccus sp.]HMQ41447.1 bifunctional (p)ppGpp synthetase/guanosine-3',5'-bis(diphosphate) 3'-pyrophosphohydrolase [Paracoccus sp. (in: a-proteobacteria)]HMR37326.1 bifunctional (p)ppGpp synthetase/guanosine-3',5'-bis(diphosphate) 3'-pyrophosphohydrolase [Paracoccus sp. (in: a-proteobacteria)]